MLVADPQEGYRDKAVGENAEEGISLPLYAAGLVVTLCGVLTVTTAAVSQNGGSATQTTAILLTLLGFAFSLACRHLKVSARLIEIGCLAFVLYIGYELLSQKMDAAWFLGDADRSDTKLAAGLMWLSVLRAWTLISDDLVMFSCVLTAAMIGLIGTQDVNTTTVIYFSVFVLAMTFLLIHQNYLQNRRLAAPRERDLPFLHLIPAQVGLTALCGLVVLALGAVLIAPAEALFAGVSLAQALRGLVGPDHVHGVADTGGDGERFSDAATFAIGQGSTWPTTSDVLMHVSPSDQQPHYWRGRTYDLYLGSGWQSTLDVPIEQAPGGTAGGRLYNIDTGKMIGEGHTGGNPLPRGILTASFDVRGDTDGFYYADEPHTILYDSSGGSTPRAYEDGRIDLDGHPIQAIYTVSSAPPPDLSSAQVQEHLRRDGRNYPTDITQLYLRPSFDPAQNPVTTANDITVYKKIVRQALAGLPPDRHTPFDKAVAIQTWISGHCTYSLNVKPIPPQEDHVRYFLADSRRGYCDLFASSMVVLCRIAGVPARVATGFAPGDRDDTGFNLRALDKHAWVEVYFPGDHWQIFDPTVGTRTDGTIPTIHASTVSLWPRLWRAVSSGGPLPIVLIGGILVSVLYLVKTELYDGWRARRIKRDVRLPRQNLAEEYGLMTRALARLGLPRHAWETPAEYEARAVPFLMGQETALGVPLGPAVVSAVTTRFAAARYSGDGSGPMAGPGPDVRQFAHAAARARRILAWRRFWRVRSPKGGN